jgi:flagellar motor protein MotB
MPLSQSRAEALRDYLIGQGIDGSRIGSVEGRGKSLLTGEEAFSVIARKAEVVLTK